MALAAASAGRRAQGPAAGDAIDQLFASVARPDAPGCSVGVSRAGEARIVRGYRLASLESGVPIAPDSVFHVASISKQFTAMSILLLAQDGRLSIDDEVRRYVPEWTDRHHVTIRSSSATSCAA